MCTGIFSAFFIVNSVPFYRRFTGKIWNKFAMNVCYIFFLNLIFFIVESNIHTHARADIMGLFLSRVISNGKRLALFEC
jgi:hypothetical protein